MRNPLIHRGFFREMVRQLRTKGLVGTFILAGVNLIVFSVLITRDPLDGVMGNLDPRLMALPMLLFLYVMSPIMVFGAYRWLCKRVMSDFYHALPLSRTQIYASATAAIFLWLLIALGSYAVVNALLFTVFGMPFNYLLFLCVFLNMLLAAIEIVAAFSIGSALCGRRFAAFFQSVTVLFLPRILLTAFWMFVEGDSGLATPFSLLPFFLNPAFNIAATPIHSLIYNIDFANVPAMLYSLVYGAALLTLGCIAFRRRKSELAENPYASKVLQTAARVMVGMWSLISVIVLLNLRVASIAEADEVFSAYMLAPMTVSAVIFSFIFYCLYELISSKKWKPVVKAMPFYGLCIVLALFYIFVPNWIADLRKPSEVSADEIKSYRFNSESSLLLPFGIENTRSYPDYLLEHHTFSDLRGKALIATQSKKYQSWHSYGSLFYSDYAVVRDGGLFRKVVYLPDSSPSPINGPTRKQIYNTCMNDPAFADKLLSYPKGLIWYDCDGLTAAEAKEVGRLFREYFEKLTPEQRETLINTRNSLIDTTSDANVISLRITLYGCVGTNNYRMSYKLNELTPNAARCMLDCLNARYEKDVRQDLRDFVRWMEHPDDSISLSTVHIGTAEFRPYMVWSSEDRESFDSPKEAHPAEYQMLKALSEAPLATDPAHCVTVRVTDYHYSGSIFGTTNVESMTIGLNADEPLMKMILQWMRDRKIDDVAVSYDGV